MDNMLQLQETSHPNRDAKSIYDSLIGINHQKDELLKNLSLLLDNSRIEKWKNVFDGDSLNLMKYFQYDTPLVILSGEVGCGKTALAQSIATPLAEVFEEDILVMETPSNIRGSGLVGEISNRITQSFQIAKAKIAQNKKGILIIDEADDIATSRSQNQAHHEDRAGLNVLIKQIDLLKREKTNLAVILITNRASTLDPAVKRRMSLQLTFDRPKGDTLKDVLSYLLEGCKYSDEELQEIYHCCNISEVPYSFSDLIQRVGKQAILTAIDENQAFTASSYLKHLKEIAPTSLLKEE